LEQGKYSIKTDKIIENDELVTEFIDNIKKNMQASTENKKKEVDIIEAYEKINAGYANRIPVL